MKAIKKIIGFGVIVLMASCQNPQSKSTEQKIVLEDSNIISCEGIGPVKLIDTHNDMVNKFGKDNLVEETKDFDGKSMKVTRVFADTPEEVIVVWAQNGGKAARLLIQNELGPYKTEENLRVGISLRDVVRINNYLPVTFPNFYKDTEGFTRIASFNGGDIAKKYPCLNGTLEIVKFNGIDKNVLENFKKVDTLKSSDNIMNQIVIRISEISVSSK